MTEKGKLWNDVLVLFSALGDRMFKSGLENEEYRK